MPRRLSRSALGCVALLLVAALGCGNRVIDIDPDLVAHWALDESEPVTTVVDSSGFELNGTASPNPPVPMTETPPHVHFLHFNGQDQYVAFGSPDVLNTGGLITVCAWIRPESTAGYQNIVAHGYTADNTQDEALRIKEGTYEFTYWNNAEHDGIATVPSTDVGSWVHLCGVFDGSSYLVYHNGKQVAVTVDATVPPAGIPANWGVGAHVPSSDNATRFMQGSIDDVRIYRRALSKGEVESLYASYEK